MISEAELAYAQRAFPWTCSQEIPGGSLLGYGPRWPVIDPRLAKAVEAGIRFEGSRVLEAGCCDGHVTVGLCKFGAMVTSFDARLVNVLKTTIRTAAWGFTPCVKHMDASQITELGRFDILVHFGVLYHLPEPAAHLRLLGQVSDFVLLDTHTAIPGEPLVDEHGCQGHGWPEDCDSPLGGMQSRSFWLTRDSLFHACSTAGFDATVLNENDAAPHGPRSILLLRRR